MELLPNFCCCISGFEQEKQICMQFLDLVMCCYSVAQLCLTLCDSLQPHGLQHARLPCPSLSPGVCSNSCPLSWRCHPTISTSVSPFSSCPQSFHIMIFFPCNNEIFSQKSLIYLIWDINFCYCIEISLGPLVL